MPAVNITTTAAKAFEIPSGSWGYRMHNASDETIYTLDNAAVTVATGMPLAAGAERTVCFAERSRQPMSVQAIHAGSGNKSLRYEILTVQFQAVSRASVGAASFATLTGEVADNAALVAALAAKSNVISTPKVYHVATNGNDTTGDGSLAKPFLTLAKAFAVGELAATGYIVSVGAGTFTFVAPQDSYSIAPNCKEICGVSAAMTVISLDGQRDTLVNDNGIAGVSIGMRLNNLVASLNASGGDVIENNETPYTAGAGGTINVSGNAVISSLLVNGGGESSTTGIYITGGDAGNVDVVGCDMRGATVDISEGVGAAGSGLGGQALFLFTMYDGAAFTQGSSAITVGNSAIKNFTPTNDIGGNSTLP